MTATAGKVEKKNKKIDLKRKWEETFVRWMDLGNHRYMHSTYLTHKTTSNWNYTSKALFKYYLRFLQLKFGFITSLFSVTATYVYFTKYRIIVNGFVCVGALESF